MLFKSPIITQASGSVGGTTASRNRGGMYFRSRAVPVNPNSNAQVNARSRFSSASQAWSQTLTQAQRDEWNDYASNVPVTNKLGDQIFITGQNFFIAQRTLTEQLAVAAVSDGPSTMTLADLGSISLGTIGTGPGGETIDVDIAGSPSWAAQDAGGLLIQMSPQQSPGISFFKAPFTNVDLLLGNSTTPVTTITVDIPNGLATGNKIFVRVRAVEDDGRMSIQNILSAVR